MVSENIDYNSGRMKASDEMRRKATQLEEQAAGWRKLAEALEEIEKHASTSFNGPDLISRIGAGSEAEAFLWQLAVGYVK